MLLELIFFLKKPSSAVREDYFADGGHALGYDSNASEDGPITIGGDWSVFTNNMSLCDHEVFHYGQGRAEHLSPHPSSFYKGYPRECVNTVFRTALDKSPMPCMENPPQCSDHGQIRSVPGIPDFEVSVYPRNPRVHWMFHGVYNTPSSKLHFFSTPHTSANFMGRDLPSLTYEDPALETVMTVTIPTPIHPILTCLRPSRVIRIISEHPMPLPNSLAPSQANSCLSNALPNTPTPLHLVDASLTRCSFNLSSSSRQVDS